MPRTQEMIGVMLGKHSKAGGVPSLPPPRDLRIWKAGILRSTQRKRSVGGRLRPLLPFPPPPVPWVMGVACWEHYVASLSGGRVSNATTRDENFKLHSWLTRTRFGLVGQRNMPFRSALFPRRTRKKKASYLGESVIIFVMQPVKFCELASLSACIRGIHQSMDLI